MELTFCWAINGTSITYDNLRRNLPKITDFIILRDASNFELSFF